MSGALFKGIAAAYLAYYMLRKQDRGTMEFQMRTLNAWFGEMEIASIDETAVERFFGERIAKGISRSTCNRNLSALNGLFEWARKRGYIERSPTADMPRFPETPAEPRTLTPEEIAALIMASAPHLKAYLMTLAYAGSRMTETLRLTWRRIDFAGNAITFTRETVKGKTRSRTVPMAEPLRDALLALRRGPPDSCVFLYNERPVTSMRTALRTAARRAGVGRIGFHTLRHSFGQFFIERDGPLVLLQRILGHGSIGVTMRYVHTSPRYVASAVDYMGPPRGKHGERLSE